MPHPYTEAELDGATWTEHTGTCGNCYPVDPENMTQAEKETRSRCPYCLGSGEIKAQLLDANGLVFECEGCGEDTRKITRHLKGDGTFPLPRLLFICRNCLTQEHHDSCRDSDGTSPCMHGWLVGA